MGGGLAPGINQAAQSIASGLEKRWDRQYAQKESLKKVKADELMNQIHSTAANAQEVLRNANGNEQDPAYQKLATTGKGLIQQYRQLFGDKPQEFIEHLKNFKPKQYQKLQEQTSGLPTWEGETAAVPIPEDPAQKDIAAIRAKLKAFSEFNPNATEEEQKQFKQNLFGMQPAQPSAKELFDAEQEAALGAAAAKLGKKREELTPEEITNTLIEHKRALEKPAVKKPLDIKNNAATGGLEALEDPNTGTTYHAGNIATAPPEVKQQWDAIIAQQKSQAAQKAAEEDKRTLAASQRQEEAFQLALKRQDYAAAAKTVKAADDEYQASIDRAATMDQNLANALKGDQQAMLSLVANHIGMTLGAQKGARINRAVWDEAVQSAPWFSKIAAKFDDRGWLSGVTLAPEQMTQMVSLAHEKVEVLRSHKDRVQEEYSDALGAKKTTPADLKKKVQETGAAQKTQAHKVGDTVAYQGKQVKITKINPDGTFEAVVVK